MFKNTFPTKHNTSSCWNSNHCQDVKDNFCVFFERNIGVHNHKSIPCRNIFSFRHFVLLYWMIKHIPQKAAWLSFELFCSPLDLYWFRMKKPEQLFSLQSVLAHCFTASLFLLIVQKMLQMLGFFDLDLSMDFPHYLYISCGNKIRYTTVSQCLRTESTDNSDRMHSSLRDK